MICCVEIRPSIDRTVPERDRLSIRQERRPDLRAGPVRADQNRCSRGRAIRKVGRRPEGRGLDTRALLAKRHLILETTQKNLTQCRPLGLAPMTATLNVLRGWGSISSSPDAAGAAT